MSQLFWMQLSPQSSIYFPNCNSVIGNDAGFVTVGHPQLLKFLVDLNVWQTPKRIGSSKSSLRVL